MLLILQDLETIKRLHFILTKFNNISIFYQNLEKKINNKKTLDKSLSDLDKIIDEKTYKEIKNIGLSLSDYNFNYFYYFKLFINECRKIKNKKQMIKLLHNNFYLCEIISQIETIIEINDN